MLTVMEVSGTQLDAVKAVFTQIMEWMTSLVTSIASSPLLLIPVGIFVVGAVIGLASRLIGR